MVSVMTTTLVRQHHRRKAVSPALKPGSPFYPETTSRLASKRLQAQRSERANTPPVVKVAVPVAYVSPGILTNLASSIREYIGRAM